jgi:hypothetical protein
MAEDIEKKLAEMMDPGAAVDVKTRGITSQFGGFMGEEAPSEEVPETETVEEEKDPKGKTIWIEQPTFEDQYKRFPQTTRLVGPIVVVFDAANPEQLKDLNAFLAKQQPEEAPRIVIASRKENFHEGKWLMLLEYFRVEYKQLITTS